MASQQQSSMTPAEFRDSWETPDFVFDYINERVLFDIDLAASESNAKCINYYDESSDGLNQSWHKDGNNGWLNPPYSRIDPWIKQAINEAKQGFFTFMLIPTFNGQDIWKDIFEHGHVTNIVGRLSFKSPCDFSKITNKGKSNQKIQHIKKGEPVPGNTSASCIVQFGGPRVFPEWILRKDMEELKSDERNTAVARV